MPVLNRSSVPAQARSWLLRAGGPATICALVLVVNLPGLLHLVDVNPLDRFSGFVIGDPHGVFPGLDALDADVGWTAQALGHRAAVDWLHGQIPWWNPFEGLGVPLAAEMQAAAFFPPVLLFAFAGGSLYFHIFLEMVAGVGTYFLLRELALSRWVATVGGLLFAFSGTFAWLWHAPMNPVALLPVMLLGVERLVRQPRANAGWMILAGGIALSFYAGFPESTYLDGLFVVAWAVFRVVQARRTAGTWRPLLARLALGGVAGTLLSLPLLSAFAEYLPHAYTGLHANDVGYTHLGSIALPILGVPYLYGPLFGFNQQVVSLDSYFGPVGGFVAASTVVVGVAGLLSARRERERGLRIFLAAVAVVTLAWSFGIEPFAKLTTILPYMGHILVPRYIVPVWELALVILACFGLEALVGDDPVPDDADDLATGALPAAADARPAWVSPRTGLLAGVGVLALLGLGMLVSEPRSAVSSLVHMAGSRPYVIAAVAWCGAVVAGLVVTALAVGSHRGAGCRHWPALLAGTLLVLDASTMAFIPQLSAPRSVRVDTQLVSYLAGHLELGRFYSIGTFHSDYGAYYATASIDTTDLPVPAAWATETGVLAPNTAPLRFDGRVNDPKGPSALAMLLDRLPAYERLAVQYVVVVDLGGRPAHTGGLRLVYDDGTAAVYALPHPGPYWSFVGGSCTVSGGSSLDAATIDCPAPTTLVRAGLYMPGWTATVNGSAVPVAAYQGLLTSVRVPAGRSQVAFSYTPPRTNLALAGFLVGLALLVGVPLAGSFLRRRRPAAVRQRQESAG